MDYSLQFFGNTDCHCISWFIQRKVTQTFLFGRGEGCLKFLSLIIYLSRVLCLPSVVSVCFMYHYNNQTDQGTDGFLEGEGWEGRCEGTTLYLGLAKENFSFTVPPAVAFLHYLRSGIFRGFSLNIITFAGRISEAAMGGAGARSAPLYIMC